MKQKIRFRSNPDLEFIRKDYMGNIVVKRTFCNGILKDDAPLRKVIRWKFSSNPQKKEKAKDNFKLKICDDFSFNLNNDNVIVWLGHSSFYLRLNGAVFITDPVFSNLSLIKRRVRVPYKLADIGKVDYVLISHTHYDHLDIRSLKSIVKLNPGVEILGPLGLKGILKRRWLKPEKVQEAGWYQIYKSNDAAKVVFLPARHWSRRGLFDFNKVLWGSFGITVGDLKIYFAGDTAKNIDHFNNIRKLYHEFDICFLPIGAYSPTFVMAEAHLNPSEALGAFKILNGKFLIPMHYGTYDLSDEPPGEPLRLLKEKAATIRLTGTILDLSIGEPLNIDDLKQRNKKKGKRRENGRQLDLF